MDKLEHYLDQVCRSIGGPKALRQHVRQELREHLRDAAAQYRGAGLPEEEALARALEDFGGPEQIRTELEATHGHRLLPVAIDKAMQWKEMTMKAKWLWTTWAHLAVLSVIALEIFSITFAVLFLIPKFRKLLQDGMLDAGALNEHGLSWMQSLLVGVGHIGDYTTWIAIGTAAVWGLFEWRVKSENKTLMRLSALGTIGAGLMAVLALMSASMVIPFLLALPAMNKIARPFALEQVANVDASVLALEQAAAKKDWAALEEQANRAYTATARLGAAAAGLTSQRGSRTGDELRSQAQAANNCAQEMQQAIRDKDAGRLDAALRKFQELYKPLREAAKKQDN